MARVLYVSHTSELGGAEHSLLLLLERLDRTRFEPVVAAPGRGALTGRLEALGVAWHAAPMERIARTWNPARLVRYWMMWRKAGAALEALMADVKPDLVHANSTTAHLFASPAARRRGVPCIWHVRDMSSPGRIVEKWLTRDAALIIANSESVKRRLRHPRLAREKAVVVYNGVDTERFSPGDGTAVRREIGVRPTVPLAGIVGQIVPWKGHGRFLDAVAIASRRVPEARFVVAGDNRFGDFPRALDELKARAAELGVSDRVFFLGWRDDIVGVLRGLDLLVLASENEPFGRVVIEAMACGKPVVSFRSGGPVEIIEEGKTGILVDPYEVPRLAGAMVRLLSNPDEAAVMGARGRQVVCERFSAERYVTAIQQAYESVLAMKPGM